MEIIEKNYRETSKGHKKYVKCLTEYINHLLSKGRVLEANYYFKELSSIKPDHIKSIMLGYMLSIKTFDNRMVSYFDKRLCEFNREEELICFRLQYYYSVGKRGLAEECALHLLSKKCLREDTFRVVSEIFIHSKSYELVFGLSLYMKRNNMVFHKGIEKSAKNAVLTRLIEVLARRLSKCF